MPNYSATTAYAGSKPNTSLIAAQNDSFRKLACLGTEPGYTIPGRLVVTPSIIEGGEGYVRSALEAVGSMDDFEPENDPDGLHDFGTVDVRGKKVFWKLDLYEAGTEFRYGAEDPANTDTTMRVLTVMMARDW
ncbi:DUF3768 domain-containing protein [uncultured Tateyamaria sp.]|uniref:DUF3768 domain-containing protein n=1 Tax=uncultured Tateyamaria sp. TaxID=455651 RepID=UPI00260C524A|nr:DUF3768 domain-containing protein [uncultured Tateyamaria sp.]